MWKLFKKKEHSTKDLTLWSRRYVHEQNFRKEVFNERPYTGANVAYKREHKIRSISRVNCHCAINVRKWWTLMLKWEGSNFDFMVKNENTFQCMNENFSLYKFTCNISVNIIVLRNGINVDLRVNVLFGFFIQRGLCNVFFDQCILWSIHTWFIRWEPVNYLNSWPWRVSITSGQVGFAKYWTGWISWNFRKISNTATFSHTSILKFYYDSNPKLGKLFFIWQVRFGVTHLYEQVEGNSLSYTLVNYSLKVYLHMTFPSQPPSNLHWRTEWVPNPICPARGY